MERIYLDYNATAPLRPEAREAMLHALDLPGNPSSVHGEGRAARRMIDEARGQVARALGADPRYVTFTSGGTEAANLVLTPSLKDNAGRVSDLIVSAGEHPCVLEGHRFAQERVHRAPVDAQGRLDYTVDPARCDSFYDAVRRYWPDLKDGALQPGYAGVRPKIVPKGAPGQDFSIQGPAVHGAAGMVNLFGIESPGLTAGIAIAAHVAEMVK